jgi:hypothetical protein
VPVERSRAEIERTLERYGCDATMIGKDSEKVAVFFRFRGIPCKLEMPRSRDKSEANAAKQDRQAMRILLLLLKAKLEAVEAGIQSFEVEFCGALMLPNGQTMAEHVAPQIANGQMPRALPGLGETTR